MGNKILGKRSRNFYKGLNQRQINYIKEKFSTISKNNALDKNLFMNEYKLSQTLVDKFFDFVDFDESNGIDEYEFICAVHTFCNMTVSQLGEKFFQMIIQKSNKQSLNLKQMKNFTEVCIKYNYSLENKPIEDTEITKINKQKFLKYDYDKNKSISKQEFIAICTKDEDYKKWFYNMGFITKNQLQFNDQVYDLVDSDIEDQIQRHLKKSNPKVDKLKRGIEHKIPNDDDFEEVQDQGEQSLPTVRIQGNNQASQQEKPIPKQPWQKFLEEAKCQINKTMKENPNSPSQSLTIRHIFGYRSYDCRNNIKFDLKGNMVYHQGSVGIIMNEKRQQFYMNEHKDDIVCLDINDNMIVTGEMGSTPSVILWTSNTQGSIKSDLIVTQGLKQSVGNVAMSKTSKFLAVNCNDSDHKLIIYDISCLSTIKSTKNKQASASNEVKLQSSGHLTKNSILDLKFTPDQKYVVAASLKQILFVRFQNTNLNADRGEFGQFSNSSALCLLPLKVEYKKQKRNWMISGMVNGSIYFWQQKKCVKAVSGHTGSVSALASIKQKGYQSFVSGDKSGKIIVWGENFQIINRCSIVKSNVYSNMIVSISITDSKDGRDKQILVGTKSSTVYKDQLKKDLIFNEKNAIIFGHNEGNLWALAVDQSKNSNTFYTGGQDQRLIKWQYGSQNKLIQQAKCKYKIRTISHSQKQKVIAVGYINGVIQIFDQSLKPTKIKFDTIKNADKQVLNLIKFSEDGKYLIACYTFIKPDQSKRQNKSTWSYGVIIFSFNQKQLKKQKQIDQTSKIIAVDLNKENEYLRLNNEAHQFKVYNITQKIPAIVEKKYYNKIVPNLQWQTHSVFMSPQTQKFKTQGVTQADIICCQRSSKRRNVFLIGDKYSKIKLFNYPCINYPIFNKYQGHSNAVTSIRFDSQQKYVISIGAEQKSIIVWQYDPDIVNNAQFFNQLKEQTKQLQSDLIKAKGQQCGANPEYKGYIKQPSDFKQKYNPKRDNKLPNQQFSIQHVFGIRSQYLKDQVRNQCRFSKNYDFIIFPTACLGVKMNTKTKQQSFYHQHKEDIVSFAVDKTRTYMATGQMAQKNIKDPRKKIVSISVWDIQSNKLLKKLDGFHTIAVVLLEFSPSGKLLFSVGNDPKNSYAVYDWKAGSILYSGPISGGKVNGIAWKNQTQFMTCGNDHVKLWQNGKGKQGKFSHGKLQSMFSCAHLKDDFYATGSGLGTVFIWKGTTTMSANKAHGKGKVQTITYKNDILYTGGDDGNIKSWKLSNNGEMKQLKVVFDPRNLSRFQEITNTKQIQQEEYGILSIDIGQNMDALIVTKGATVVKFNFSDQSYKNAKILHQGHYKEELWGLATYQNDKYSRYVITGGDDKTVRLWDLQKKEEIRRVYLQRKCRAVDCQQSGSFNILAADTRAKLYLIDKNLTSIKDRYTGAPYDNYNDKSSKITEPWVEEVKFSPLSDKICYGTHGQSRYLEIVSMQGDKFNKKAIKFQGGSSAVNHIDWSRQGNEIAINTQAWQYLFYSSEGKAITSASSLRDEQWSTYTRKYGFQSQGIFQDSDHSNINTICRDPSKSILAVGYDDQTIRVFKYPCYIPKQVFKTLYGHSSHVTKVRFTDQKMVSIGGLDRTLIVWNIEGRPQYKDQGKYKLEEEDDGLDDLDEDVDLPNNLFKKKPKPVQVQDFTETVDQGDEFMAIKPWVGAIKQPTYQYPKTDGKQPNAAITLQYVFGYRSKDCRQNLFYKNETTIIYHAAAVMIQHDIANNQQKLFTQHNDDIISIDYHQDKDIVLTGQVGPKPLVCLYKESRFQHSFKAPVTKGVIAISISPSGKFGVCIGMDENHQIAVLDLSNYAVLAKQKGGRKVITKIKWISDSEFVTIGINFYAQWKYQAKKIKKIIQTAPRFNNVSLDIDQKTNLILVGANNSSLFNCAKDKNLKTSIFPKLTKNQNQKSPSIIEAVKITDQFIISGTRNGKIVFLDKNSFSLKAQFDLKTQLDEASSQQFNDSKKSENSCIRSLDFYENKLLIGTLGSQIYQVEIDKKLNVKKDTWRNIMKGHFTPNPSWLNEVWGLTVSQGTTDYILTCSDDSTIRVWSLDPKPHLVYCINLNPKKDFTEYKNSKYPDDLRLRSIALSPNGKYIAVGAYDGTLRIFKFDPTSQFMLEQQPICTVKHAKQWVSDIKFGFQSLIVGSHDNGIYVYNFEKGNNLNGDLGENEQLQEEFSKFNLKLKYKPMKKHSSYITHMDVSKDSCFLQSTCGAYEILFWDLNSGKQITSGASMLRDEMWKSWTCNIGWPVQGIYPKQQDGTFINSVDRSNTTINQHQKYENTADYFLLAAGNDHGKVGIYSYPSLVKNSKYIQGKGHSSHVTTVRWTKDDSRIISVGGQDQCVMVWKVQKMGNSQKIMKSNTKTNKFKR